MKKLIVSRTRLHHIIIPVIFIVVLMINLWWFESIWLGVPLAVFFIRRYGERAGRLLDIGSAAWRRLWGTLALLSWLSFSGAVIYLAWRLGNVEVFFLITITVIILESLAGQTPHQISLPKIKLTEWLDPRVVLQCSGYILAFSFLIFSPITEAVRSPWDTVGREFISLYLMLTMFLVYNLATLKNQAVKLLLLSWHFFLSFGLALIVYPLGYGFDSFIHQATERLILLRDAVTPKPFYYLGQYSLTVTLAKLASLPITLIDRWLLPLASTVFLPGAAYLGLKAFFRWTPRATLLATLTLLAVPFSTLIVTTPQGLANLLALLVIFLALVRLRNPSRRWFIFLILLALTATVTHPLTGIPLLIFLGLIKAAPNIPSKIKPLFIVLCGLSLPAVFWLNSLISSTAKISWGFNAHATSFLQIPYLQNRFQLLYDLIYFYGFNFTGFFLVSAAIGLWLAHKNKMLYKLQPYFLTAIVLFINYLIINYFIRFNTLIYYERGDYAERLIQLSLFFLLPFFLLTFKSLFDVLTARFKKTGLAAVALLVGLMVTAGFYFTYPRNDDSYEVAHAYNTASADFAAVKLIDGLTDEPYIVLANQAVSAAALVTFGFDRYYNNHYFYPIPTGGELYNFYLQMVNDSPSRDTMLQAMTLADVSESFLVLNDYWHNATSLASQAKQTADSWHEIANGKILIFHYKNPLTSERE